jgi:hypothetical protein
VKTHTEVCAHNRGEGYFTICVPCIPGTQKQVLARINARDEMHEALMAVTNCDDATDYGKAQAKCRAALAKADGKA